MTTAAPARFDLDLGVLKDANRDIPLLVKKIRET